VAPVDTIAGLVGPDLLPLYGSGDPDMSRCKVADHTLVMYLYVSTQLGKMLTRLRGQGSALKFDGYGSSI